MRGRLATIFCVVLVAGTVASWEFVLVAAKSVDSGHVVIVLQLGMSTAWMVSIELISIGDGLNRLSGVRIHCGQHCLASTPWSDHHLTKLHQRVSVSKQTTTYLVWVEVGLLLVFHLPVEVVFHLPLLHHLKLSLNHVC